MEEHILYSILAVIIAVVLLILSYLVKNSKSEKLLVQDVAPPVVQPRAPVLNMAAGDGPRNRAAAIRNARARMRVAQAQRLHSESDDEDDLVDLDEEITLPSGKVGKKKLAKLQMKAEKKAQREAEEHEREQKKEREEQKAELQRQKEKEREEAEALREEEERKRREEEEKRQQEEYERMKVEFQIEEEGFEEEEESEDKEKNLLNEFLIYIKNHKVVVLEDVAAHFNLKTQVVIDRLVTLQKDGNITGVLDDRGKFIYICQGELESIAKFIKQRGRVSISDLAEASNTLVNLTPESVLDS